MAINWNLFPQAFNRQQEEIGNQYDFSFVTPEVVKGFTRYQALRPEEDVKKANKYKEILENINDEDLNTIFGNELDEEVAKAVDWDSPDEEDSDEKWKNWTNENLERRRKEVQGTPVYQTSGEKRPDFPEIETRPIVDEYESTYDRDALVEKYMRNTLGSDYDSYKRAYGIYGNLNPRRQMLEAAKRSSYWDPEIGKIYSNYADKMYEENLKAWEQARKTASENRDYALKMYQATDGMPSYLAEAEYWQKEIKELDKKSPNLTGGWFEGLTEEQAQKYGTRQEPSKSSNELWSTIRTGRVAQTDEKGNPLYYSDKTQAMRQMTENDLKNSESFKALPPEEQAYWLQQFRKNSENLEQQDLNRTNAVNMQAEKLAPVDFEEWQNINKSLNKGRLVNFEKEGTAKVAKKDAKGNKIYETVPAYTENQAIDAMVYLETKGINVDKLFEKNPEFRQLRKEYWGEGEKVSLGNLGKVGLMNFVTALKRDNILEANINKIMNLAEREYEKDVRLEKDYGDKIRAKLKNKGINYSGTQFDPRESETPRTMEYWNGTTTNFTSGSPKTEDKEVDVESFDWSGAPYQTATLKKELKKALNGEESKFKKLENGTYQWVGGAKIQTFDPSTGKITQVNRNPQAGRGQGSGNAGNASTGANKKSFQQMTREEKRNAVVKKRG